MLYLILSLLALGLISAFLGLLSHNKEGQSDVIIQGSDCGSCSGDNAKCELQCRLEAAVKEVEYFDDEELDQFARRSASAYSDDEAEQFREVLYTMQPREVRAWTRSLEQREIELPDQVKDEVIILLNEE